LAKCVAAAIANPVTTTSATVTDLFHAAAIITKITIVVIDTIVTRFTIVVAAVTVAVSIAIPVVIAIPIPVTVTTAMPLPPPPRRLSFHPLPILFDCCLCPYAIANVVQKGLRS
jgi:hypothetical protein